MVRQPPDFDGFSTLWKNLFHSVENPEGRACAASALGMTGAPTGWRDWVRLPPPALKLLQ